MKRVRLTVDVEPELRRRIRIAAASSDESIREWLQRAILHELDEGPAGGSNYDLEREYYSSEGGKPRGLREGAPKLDSGDTLSEAVIEDRR